MQSNEDSCAPVPQRRLARGRLRLLTGTSWHLVVANCNNAGTFHLFWQTFCSSRCSSGINLLCEMRHNLAISSFWNETTPCITCAIFFSENESGRKSEICRICILLKSWTAVDDSKHKSSSFYNTKHNKNSTKILETWAHNSPNNNA